MKRFGNCVLCLFAFYCGTIAAAGTVQAQTDFYVTLEARIGVVEGPAEYTIGRVADLAFGPGESIYVLDVLSQSLVVYGLDGRYQRRLGRSGEGPGEFLYPTKLMLSPEHVAVADPAQQRIVRFRHNGQHVETVRLEREAAGYDVVVPLRGGTTLLAKSSSTSIGHELMRLIEAPPGVVRREGPRARQSSWQSIAVRHDNSGRLDTLKWYDHGFVTTIGPRGVGHVPRYWGAGAVWTTAGDSLVVIADAFTGDVQVFKSGIAGLTLVRSGRIPIDPRRLAESDWRAVEAAHLATSNGTRANYVFGPSYQAQIGSVVVSDDGTIWVRRIDFRPSEATPRITKPIYLVIPQNGPQQVVQLPIGFDLRAARGDLLLGYRRTELGVDVVELWRRAYPSPGA
jgi:hypothetical protein